MLEATIGLYYDESAGNQAAYAGALGATNGGTPQQQQAVGAGPRPSLLSARAQAEAAQSLAMRPAENVPVYVMLPLDTVNAEGVFKYAFVPWFAQALQVLALSGVHGVAVDVWWCAIERAPRQYSWTGYKQLFEMVRAVGLKLQVVLSFHACGGNVGDMAQVPLPPWVLQAGLSDPDIFFTDRPRESGLGQRNKEYLSIWADDCPVLPAGPPAGSNPSFGGRPAAAAAGSSDGGGMRTPLQCYVDLMVAFREEFAVHLGTLIEEVVVGSGPCGELRYPSYVEANGWRFPGVGEFQCYDRRALASLAAAAEAAGHPEWGYAGPHDSGGYNSLPLDTDFFKPHGGSWDTDYGDFFLSWYSSSLLKHGERLLQLANQAFAPFMPKPRVDPMPHAQAVLQHLQQQLHNGSSNGAFAGGEWAMAAAAAAAAVAAAGSAAAIPAATPAEAAAAEASPAHAGALTAATDAQQAQAMLQRLLTAVNGAAAVGSGSCAGSNISCTSPAGDMLPAAAGLQPVGELVPPCGSIGSAAASPPAAGQLPAEALQTARSVLQQLLQSGRDSSSSLQQAQLPPVFAAAAAAAGSSSSTASAAARGVLQPAATVTAGPAGRGLYVVAGSSSECLNASSFSMPTASSLQSSSSTLDLSTTDLLSVSQQHLAGLSLNSSRESDMSLSQGGSSSPAQPPAAAPAAVMRAGVSQLLQTPTAAPAAAAVPPAAALVNGYAGVQQSEPASQAEPAARCNGALTAAAAASGSNDFVAGSNSCSSDMSCLTRLGSSSAAAAAVMVAGAIGDSNSSSSTAASDSSLGPPAAAAAAAAAVSAPVMQLFLQLIASLTPAQQQPPQQQHLSKPQPVRQVSQLQLQQQRKPLVLSLKIAGVHWWYNSTSHASELTAGYYNTDSRDGYFPILELCERYNVNLTITCVEMCDAQHPSYALCGPEGLLRQIRAMAARRKVTLSGENALPIFTPHGIDATALDRVVSNVRACRSASLRSCSSWPGPGPSNAGSSGGYGRQQYHQQHYSSGGWGSYQQQQQQQQHQSMLHSMGNGALGATSLADSIHRQCSGGWPPQPQPQHEQQPRLMQQQHQQQLLWYGADRLGGHQHTGSHITSNSRNFSELGTLLQVYSSGSSVTSGTPRGGLGPSSSSGGGSGGGVYCGALWQQRSSESQISGGRSSPNGDGSNDRSGGEQQQQRAGAGKAAAGSGGGSSSEADVLPAMRAFTFLRLGPEILQPECHTSWMRFMHRMLNERA